MVSVLNEFFYEIMVSKDEVKCDLFERKEFHGEISLVV